MSLDRKLGVDYGANDRGLGRTRSSEVCNGSIYVSKVQSLIAWIS